VVSYWGDVLTPILNTIEVRVIDTRMNFRVEPFHYSLREDDVDCRVVDCDWIHVETPYDNPSNPQYYGESDFQKIPIVGDYNKVRYLWIFPDDGTGSPYFGFKEAWNTGFPSYTKVNGQNSVESLITKRGYTYVQHVVQQTLSPPPWTLPPHLPPPSPPPPSPPPLPPVSPASPPPPPDPVALITFVSGEWSGQTYAYKYTAGDNYVYTRRGENWPSEDFQYNYVTQKWSDLGASLPLPGFVEWSVNNYYTGGVTKYVRMKISETTDTTFINPYNDNPADPQY
jgi:hypothetical protein